MTLQPLGHDAVQELLGAYALDAVDADEAMLVEDHLRECPRCRAELAAHRDTAALLAHGHAEPPAALWERVATALDDAPPPLDLSRFREQKRERERARSWSGMRTAAAVAVAAMVVAVAGLTAVTVQQQRELDRVQAALARDADGELASATLAAFAHPSARHASLAAPDAGDAGASARAVVLPDGAGYLLAGGLPQLPAHRAYQLWAMVDGAPVSAGVLGSRPEVIAFHVAPDADALAISVERASGAATPTLPPRVMGVLEA